MISDWALVCVTSPLKRASVCDNGHIFAYNDPKYHNWYPTRGAPQVPTNPRWDLLGTEFVPMDDAYDRTEDGEVIQGQEGPEYHTWQPYYI